MTKKPKKPTKPGNKISRRIALATLAVTTVGLVLLSSGCGQPTGRSNSPAVAEKVKELSVLQEKRVAYEQKLNSMSVTQLAGEMSSDSDKGREQFNSAAYREAVRRGKPAANELKAQLK
ncbi:MAG TPA: hypothetical protein VJ723_02300, partial [Candidatus Angelobacter sp.]|nr:hypothetical protein [Candidatus Angelobacter sp.]